MTTPTNNQQPAGSPSDLPPLPPDATPWQSAEYRDENARLLIGAMHRQCDALGERYPDTPVQGFDVIPLDQGPAGAITCGVLITLWRQSELCRGQCPHCPGTALALAVGGTPETWYVTGVCPLCGTYVYRENKPDELLDALERSLEGSVYALPTTDQFLLSNAHQHLALLAALRTLGEKLLPPDHYGLAVATPDVMRRWQNATNERITSWARRGSIIHAATGARVEKTDATWTAMAGFVYDYLQRTGTLPELDHAGPDGLRYSFPMISQEWVPNRKPVVPEETMVSEDDEDDNPLQRAVDRLIAQWRGKQPIETALADVQQLLEESEAIQSDYEVLGVFLSPQAMAEALQEIDDDTVREALEITNGRVTQAQRIEFFEQYVLEDRLQDADVTRAFVPIVLESSDGESLQLVVGISGYSFTILEYEWHGPFEAEFDFAEWLRKEGWVETVEEFQQMGARRKAKLLG